MKPITAQTIDWIPRAPVSVTRTRSIAADRDRVWATIADHEGWVDWFGPITQVERLDAADAVGGHRRVHIRRIAVEEEFLAWDPGERFAFTITHSNAPGITAMVEDVRLTADGEHATNVSYTQAVQPVGGKLTAPLLRLLVPKAIDQGLAGLAKHLGG